MYLLLIASAVFIILILYAIYTRKNKAPLINKPTYIEKPFLQSPEYRCSTKCFDCIKEQSFQHLNPSHGNPKINFGL